ncbi:MAG: hypothetical protein BWY91_03015 [bacterium ADurb.BinA028]|nr:MAG: hypothetical protein BWY91_03015 [bacterium ADurb.BinA028]
MSRFPLVTTNVGTRPTIVGSMAMSQAGVNARNRAADRANWSGVKSGTGIPTAVAKPAESSRSVKVGSLRRSKSGARAATCASVSGHPAVSPTNGGSHRTRLATTSGRSVAASTADTQP